MNYQEKVLKLVDQQRLIIKLIIAPPRTGSTLLESSLLSSPDIDFAIHEPFISANQDPEGGTSGFKHIYDGIGGDEFDQSRGTATIVIKELSQRLDIGHDDNTLLKIADGPAAFLIRNPLLTMESRIKKIIETLPMKPRLSTQQWMLDYYANSQGFENWADLYTYQGTSTDRTTPRDNPYNEATAELQSKLLDYYAATIGEQNWQTLQADAFAAHDYSHLGDILRIDRERFITDRIDSSSLEQQVHYARDNKIGAILLDSTDFRLDPETTLRKLCREWSVSYTEKMVNWGDRDLDLRRGSQEFRDLVWYDTLATSRSIKPPLEAPPSTACFPDFVKDHLLNGDLPQYSRLYTDSSKINIREEMRGRELGAVNKDSEEVAPITIKDIDPIYASLNYPELRHNSDYLAEAQEYAEAFNALEIGQLRSPEGTTRGFRR